METTRDPEAIEDPPKKRMYDPTVILQRDGSTEEGSALRDPAFLEEFSSFTRVLSEVGIGPVIAWGDIAMMFHGIPICFTRYHVLIPDSRFEDARKVLLAEGYVDEALTYVRWTDLGCYQMHNPGRPDLFSTFLMLPFSAVHPVFEDVDITGYKQIGGIAFPPLLPLALSFIYAFSRSKSGVASLGLRSLLRCWCSYTKGSGYKPLGADAMKGLLQDEELMSFWAKR